MKGFFLILVFLVGTVFSLPYTPHSRHSTRRLLNNDKPFASGVVKLAGNMSSSYEKPPKAKKVKHEMEMFGDVRTDNYYWLHHDSHSDRNVLDSDVLAYLQEENNYTDLIMSGTKQVQDQIYVDLKGRIKVDGISTPRRRGPYYYYERSLTGKDYSQYCRRLALNGGVQPSVYDVMPTTPGSPREHVMLDVNLRAQGNTNYSSGDFEVSPNNKLVAYTESIRGDGNYTAYVFDAETRQSVGKPLLGLTYNVVWAANEALLYMTKDANGTEKVWLHKLGEEQSNDLCLYHKKDDTFSLDIEASESKKFIFVTAESTDTSFIYYIDVANPELGLIPLTPRMDGTLTSASHRGNHFFIKRTTKELYNSVLLACPVGNVSAVTTILAHRESVKIDYVKLFSNHLVVFERENGLPKVIIFNLPRSEEPIQMLQRAHAVEFVDPAYTVYGSDSDFSSSILRYTYSSLRTPETVFDYDMYTGTSVIKRIDTILGGFDSSNYFTERKWATSPDGSQVPMSIVYRKDLMKLDGTNPLLLFGYGAYAYSDDPSFDASILTLLDRGFVYVIAHVRGGGEMGSQWSANGKLLKKKNTFTDFIACAEYLIEMKYSTSEKLVINGFGSGGMLIGAVLNMRPELFKAAVAEGPFLDVLTSLLDPTTPDIKREREELGDPREEKFYNYIKSYSPVDNVSAQKYPSILVTTGLNYYRPYSNAAKFVAKMRDLKIDESLLLLECDLRVDPSTNSGWLDNYYKREAFVFAFILKALNMVY